ncbi:MAG: hypothetical protein GX787_08230 [Tissierellia bacterium]|nr:hypothetical protein [Tissierellia bacterium]
MKNWSLFDEVVEILGEEEVLLALAKALSSDELNENLAYIARVYDIREDEEEEEEDYLSYLED